MKHKLLILEGPDCVGKTTLSKHLSKCFNAVYWHTTGHRDLHGSMPAYHENILHNANFNVFEMRKAMVIDRHWPSEYVYARHFRPALFEKYPFQKMIDLAAEMDPLYIFCFANTMETAVQRHASQQNPDHPYQDKDYREIYKGYVRLYNELRLQVPAIQYSIEEWGHRLDEFAAVVKAYDLKPEGN